MSFELLRAGVANEKERWLSAFARLPSERRDVYFLPAYLQAYEHDPQAVACCAVYSDGEALLLYPFLRCPIPSIDGEPDTMNLQDIQSAYGYGGPVVNHAGETPQFLQDAWSHFADWCSEQRVVTEFTRFHPLLNNQQWAPTTMKTFNDRITIPINLSEYPKDVWDSSYYRVHRQMLRKAERVGFSFHILPLRSELAWFVPLYKETQDYLQAGKETRFEIDYFSALSEGFGEMAWLGVVKMKGEITAAAVVLESEVFLHSHLMGYRRNVATAGMTNLLYHGIAVEGANRGKQILHMGGGRSNKGDDLLLKFKASLSPQRAPFFLGAQCRNDKAYDHLGSKWEKKYGPRPPNYLQFYRLHKNKVD